MTNIAESLMVFWVQYDSLILSMAFWGVVGYAVTLPVSFINAVYNTLRIGKTYDFEGTYVMEKRRLKRSVKFYAVANIALLSFLASLTL